jgi:small ligand-binding sensory domain FIST
MLFKASISTQEDSGRAIQEICDEVTHALSGQRVDLALLFVSQHHREELEPILSKIHKDIQPGVLLGCTGEGIIGGGQELERQPALCLWVAHLPGVEIVPFHLTFPQTSGGISLMGWPEQLTESPHFRAFLLLGEPFTTPGAELLQYLQENYPGVPAVGGMASGGMDYGQNRLIFNDEIIEEGAVGVALAGPITLQTVVSQGCRPIGDRFVITRAERNIIYELGGKPALECLQQVYAGLSQAEQKLARLGLHIGYAIDEHKNKFERGDFLVRNLVGADQETKSIAIADLMKEGQTVQFHIRDRETASEDLYWLLTAQKEKAGRPPAAGGLLFSCNGRGQRLFGDPHHDITAIRNQIGDIPVAGFFAQGEIGPVGGKNFLHGFTASVALFCQST